MKLDSTPVPNSSHRVEQRGSSTSPRRAVQTLPMQRHERAQSQAPSSREAKVVSGYPPNGWHLLLRDPPKGFLSHPLDSGAKELFQCVFEKDELVGFLAEPDGEVRGLVVTSPGAGGGPGPADPEGGGGGGTYGGYNVYRKLAALLPSQGIAVLLLHYPAGAPNGIRRSRVSTTADHMETLTNWYQDRIQWAQIPTVFVGWSMGGAVVVEAAARMILAKRAQILGVATIASQTASISPTSPHLIVKSGAKLLLMAGSGDKCLSPNCTIKIGSMAGIEPEIFPGEDHGVESAFGRLIQWIPKVIIECRHGAAAPAHSSASAASDLHGEDPRRPSRNSSLNSVTRYSHSTRQGPAPWDIFEVSTPVRGDSARGGRSSSCCKLPKVRSSSRPSTVNSNDRKISTPPAAGNPARHGRSGSHCNLPKLRSSSRPSTANSAVSEVSVRENHSRLGRSDSRCNPQRCRTDARARSRSIELQASLLPACADSTVAGRSGSRRTSPRETNPSCIRSGPCLRQACASWDAAHKSPDLSITDSGLVIQSPAESRYTWHAAFLRTDAKLNVGGSYRRFEFLIEELGNGFVELGIATQNNAKKAALHWPGLRNTSAWTYASAGQRFWNIPGADELTWSQPFGEPYNTGDTISIEIDGGSLRVRRNGQIQGNVLDSLPKGPLFVGATLSTGSRLKLVSDDISP